MKSADVKKELKKIILKMEGNEKLPSERELVKKFQYSRPTIQKALNDLLKEGLIYRIPRQGAYVTERRLRKSLNSLQSFKEDTLSNGYIPSTKVLLFEKIEAEKDVASALNISTGGYVYKTIRVRSQNNDPVIYDINYFTPASISGITVEEVQDSVYSFIEEKKGLKPAMSRETIDAILPTEDIARELQISTSDPIIKVVMTAYFSDGQPFEYSISYKNPKKYSLVVQAYR
ncbi:MAG: GntR family transcriptional regulator [Lachnospiraceae bacterium]|nr:GntR family transcriptional regulator [Lachnospiraceae bacterium]